MTIQPIINSGVSPQVRRPRLTASESEAVSGPFSVSLQCSEAGKYRPAPNVLMLDSDRLAVTASPEAPEVYPWDEDFEYDGIVSSTPVQIGYLWIRSIDSDSDGLDDLESEGSVTLADCFATYGDGLLSMDDNAIAGTGNITLTGGGLIVMVNPIAGIGSLSLSGSGALGVDGVESQPIAGIGNLTLSGSGALGVASSGGGSITGTYYTTNIDRSGDFAGDKVLSTTAGGDYYIAGVDGEYYYEGRIDLSYALYKLNSSGSVVATIKDWTAIGYIDNSVGGHSNHAVQTVTGQSFADPNIGANEFFALRYRGVLNSGEDTVVSPYYTLAKGVNTGAQSGMSVSCSGEIDETEWAIRFATFEIKHARIVFAGA